MKQDLKLDEMRVVANMFTAEPGERRGEVFSRSGAMTASDGRMLIRIESPIIAETPCADARTADAFFGFAPQAETRIAGREWIEGALFPAIARRAALEGELLARRKSEAVAEAKRESWHPSFASCPRCGADLVIDGGDLLLRDEWERDFKPDPRCDGGTMALTGGQVPDGRMAFKVFYLDRMRLAGELLGDVEGLYCGPAQLVLRGGGWFVTLASLRHCAGEFEVDEEIALPPAAK